MRSTSSSNKLEDNDSCSHPYLFIHNSFLRHTLNTYKSAFLIFLLDLPSIFTSILRNLPSTLDHLLLFLIAHRERFVIVLFVYHLAILWRRPYYPAGAILSIGDVTIIIRVLGLVYRDIEVLYVVRWRFFLFTISILLLFVDWYLLKIFISQ